ncbi:MAG: single-stranded-DNA-specific exonuclease RecJ, partial [Beijerinckiaceae bacterium]
MDDSPVLTKIRCSLDVERSVLGRPWRDRLDPQGQALALAMRQLHGHSDLLARVLAGRGVSLENAAAHLDPSLRRLLPDPYELVDMKPAAARLAAAVTAGETVAIFGDYDVDGACS